MLPILQGEPYRCRDCKHRFWVGVKWGGLVLGTVTVLVVAALIVTIVVVRQERNAPTAKAAVRVRRLRRIRPLPIPRGLPPLSSVPAPDADQSDRGDKKSN